MNKIGETLKNLREAAGLSAADVSDLLDERYGIQMNYRTLYNYENGKSSPDVSRFLALCQIYGASDPLRSFGYASAHDTGFGFEELVLFEDEYSPEDWATIKTFIGHIPTIKPE